MGTNCTLLVFILLRNRFHDFDFNIVNFQFLDGDVPRRPSYGVCISQLITSALVFSDVEVLNAREKCSTAYFLN